MSIPYVVSIKCLNYHFKIESDYLTYSPWVISIIFQISLLFIIVIVWVIISSVITFLILDSSFILTDGWIEKMNNNSLEKLSNKSVSILVIILSLIIPLYYISEPLCNMTFRIDAYATSNCGETKPNTAYLRKSNKECYVFFPWFIFEEPSIIQSIKGKFFP